MYNIFTESFQRCLLLSVDEIRVFGAGPRKSRKHFIVPGVQHFFQQG